MDNDATLKQVFSNIGRRQLIAIALSIVLSIIAISSVGYVLYTSTESELELRGEMDVIESASKFDSYLSIDKEALAETQRTVDNMLVKNSSNGEILDYMTAQSTDMIDKVDETFTGLYGWINSEYLDGVGWIPDEDFIPKERPWYKAAISNPGKTVFVDPYIDEQTGQVMMTIAALLSDGDSVIALDIGVSGIQKISEEIAADTRGATVMVLDGGNVAIAHSDMSKVGADFSENTKTLEGLIVKKIGEQPEGSFSIEHDGQSYKVYYKQLEGGWYCVSAIDTAEFYRPLFGIIVLVILIGIFALTVEIVVFYRMSRRDLSNKIMNTQIKAAADIYDSLIDVNLTDDTYFELASMVREADISVLHPGAQELLNGRIDTIVADGFKAYVRELLNFSTLDERLADTDVISAEFLNSKHKWWRGRFICAERDINGKPTRVLWGVESIDEEKQEEEHLRHLAETDLMTGVYNRVAGEREVEKRLADGKGGVFVLIDIDKFKAFNDTYGHTIGDEVIIAVARCLKHAFRGDDVVMRLGGDEFAAFAPGVLDKETGEKIISRFNSDLAGVVLESHEDVSVNASAGMAFAPKDGDISFHDLYEFADREMYKNKRGSGN